ncbi:MAG: hypothetical protein E4H10_12710 [Bacteroidia bacterium]|nr:MAG: hypothetical protein E4H10_12710 [Bacteroidia bacterium]
MRKILVTTALMYVFAIVNAQIVADHSIVDHYAEIPEVYIDSVKKMLVSIPGESHSEAYRNGQNLLEQLDPTFQVQIYLGSPPPATDQYLRMGMHREGGEYLFFNESRVEELKGDITQQNSTGNPFHVMGFGWCYDMTHDNDPGGIEDPVYSVRWAGRSVEGPDGNMRWGLDEGDEALTGNRVSMDTYLEAVESWILHCEENSYPTRWIFTTGPVDYYYHAGTENGFQREIKHDYIRDYVAEDTSRILFDYADILCWSNSGEQNIVVWHDGDSLRPHAQIHPNNMMDYNSSWNLIPHTEDGDHIGEVGTVRMAKAMWWMLARMAGWDGNIPVREIQVSSYEDSTRVMTGSEWQFSATVTPKLATDKTVIWSVINGTGTASISSTGLLKGGLPGMVEVVALAHDGSGVADTMDLTIAEPLVPVSSITVTTVGGIIEVDMGSSLQCLATVLPDTATNAELSWSVFNTTGTSSISEDGLLMALTPGMVDVIATAGDGTGVADTLQVTITGTVILVSDVEIVSPGGASEVISGEDLQFTATVLPVNATNPAVTWSVINGTGSATITSEGLLTGGLPGMVEVLALAQDISGMGDTLELTVTVPPVPVTSITVSTAGGITEIEGGASLQCAATVLPQDATNPAVVWSVVNGTGSATISAEGLLLAMTSGTVAVMATASDGSNISHSLAITITSSAILVSSISISSAGGVRNVDEGNTLQFFASILPANATTLTIAWSVGQGTGSATITQNGLLTAGTEGAVLVTASARDGSGVSTNFALTINAPDGLSDSRTKSPMVLYPNPSPGKFYLDVGTLTLDKIQVFSVVGSIVREWIPEPGERVIEIDLSDQHSGAFFIHAFSKEQSYIHRIIISR